RVLLAVGPGDAEADGRHPDVALAERLLDQVVQGLLDGELAVGREVRPATPGARQDPSLAIGQQGFGLGAAGVDSYDVNGLGGAGHRAGRSILRTRHAALSPPAMTFRPALRIPVSYATLVLLLLAG